MSTFSGILLDVSGSMECSIGDGVNEEGGTWAKSIFTVTDDVVKHDVSRNNKVFAIGVGASVGEDIFDVIGTIQQIQNKVSPGQTADRSPASFNTIECLFLVLENSGARTIRKWADKYVVSRAVSEYEARLILDKLESDRAFTNRFVYDYLPEACRDWDGIAGAFQGLWSSVASSFRQATIDDIEIVANKAVRDIESLVTKSMETYEPIGVSNRSVYNVHDAADVIRGCIDERDLTSERAQELLKIVEPYIYGGTPLYSALNMASHLLSRRMYPNPSKLLFVMSDGEPGDTGDLDSIKSMLKRDNVTVVSCYIARCSEVEPKRLYSVARENWEDGAKFLFDLSSTIQSTEMITRAIFIKQGWQIDITNNEIRLFMHVNHPDNLKNVCSLARNVVNSQDALSDLLVSVSLDVYINQKNDSITAPMQVGGTCYANASATVLHLAMYRIFGRDDGVPCFEELRADMINKHGIEGANTFAVLNEVCPLYRLNCRMVDINEAMGAIAAKRPVVAKYRLTNEEWKTFRKFYDDNPTGILKKRDLDISRRTHDPTIGHAVVLTSYNSECLYLMNSWGEDFADIGFFRVANAEVLNLEFIDVYWREDDLSDREKERYRKHGSEVADKLMKSLKGLQEACFTCPKCTRTSKVTEFRGTISNAQCPLCNEEFSSTKADGNILALNMYLTSLSR
ncbi:uncharacterized protein LOC128556181 [Mercenaria mercenaria]|uniref:uncharacterized protein LOC128556181 n=1 Tax=Mercenaria mercenaria TaxID=6596 RepID=UPI00234F8736|nr:uncharacterized protein LOC128556181 [Mercenaria mercenaria]XP_053396300.1 uncharacterized protein LOC128556181 [Mercenaria mercenaria]